jgi:GAF domain-containing protein
VAVDLGALARGLGALADVDLAADARQAVVRALDAARGLLAVTSAGLMVVDADGDLRWAAFVDGPHLEGAAWREPLTVGPAVIALEELRPVVVEDVAAEAESGWEPTGGSAGVGAALCVPVLVEGAPVGVLELYRAARGGWDAGQLALARTYAGLLSVLLSAIVAAAAADELAVQLQSALKSRIEVEQAKGVLMARHGWAERVAWEQLRGSARNSRRTVVAVARELLAEIGPAASDDGRTG